MRRVLLVLVIAACEKSGPVESTPGSGSPTGPVAAPVIEPRGSAAAATIGTDAGVVAPADAAVAAATPDAAVRRPARRDDSVMISQQDAQRIADLLTADDSSDAGIMSKRRPGADLDKMIRDVRQGGGTVSVGGGGGRGGGLRTATGSGPKIDSPGTTGSGSDTTPRGRVTISDKKSFDDTSLTVDLVLAKIQAAYMAGIKRCYKNFLRQDPTARGKISLAITVNETGRSVRPKASGFASSVDECLENMMSSWRFPIPKDTDGEATEAGFEIRLHLIPD